MEELAFLEKKLDLFVRGKAINVSKDVFRHFLDSSITKHIECGDFDNSCSIGPDLEPTFIRPFEKKEYRQLSSKWMFTICVLISASYELHDFEVVPFVNPNSINAMLKDIKSNNRTIEISTKYDGSSYEINSSLNAIELLALAFYFI